MPGPSKDEVPADDDFQEFDLEDWDAKQESPENSHVWERNWDDEDKNDAGLSKAPNLARDPPSSSASTS
ncbi:hypothetical protein WJX74_009548 [Apatococcus lobatus]|uniref:26S proteasome complex subunit SEM1 n=1 Tax=Apatococcus lobatus TaxID=904363 RepID=A0AAW1R2G0_9CHLO